jgi:ABC-type branched-subunit amino acid transport system substrate-binding protein
VSSSIDAGTGSEVSRYRGAAALLLIAALWIAGCATFAPSASLEEQQDLDAAVVLGQEDPEAGRAALEAFLLKWPDSPLAANAERALGDLALQGGDADTALVHYYECFERYPDADVADACRVRAAAQEQRAGNLEAARKALSRVRVSRLDDEDRRTAYRVLADVATEPVARVRWLALLRAEVPAEDLDAIDIEIDGLLVELGAEDLDRLARQLGYSPPAGRVYIARAERALDAGDLDAAADALDRADASPLSYRYVSRLAAARQRLRVRTEGPADVTQLPTFAEVMGRALPSTAAARGTIGVALPLSGPFARFGEESLRGVLLAAGVFDREGEGEPQVRVLVRDTAGTPARAMAAVRAFAADERVSAIVGPLLSAECEAAAAAAQEAHIPLLALSAREEVAHGRSYVFRLRTRPSDDVQLLVDRAAAQGAERYAILYRADAYGRGLRDLFWDAAERSGGRVVGVAAYDPQATDFAEPIRRLAGYVLLTDEEKRLLAKRDRMLHKARRLPAEEALELREKARELTSRDGSPLPPIVDFDALFIPESYENVVLIAPQLAFHEVTDTRLLGPDGWYNEDLVRLGREHVEGSVFVAHFYPESEVGYVRDFTEHYEATFGELPDAFAAEAYDAAMLVLHQLDRGDTRRGSLRDGLLSAEAWPGVSGVLTMRADGNAQKRPFLLGVERGHVIQYLE